MVVYPLAAAIEICYAFEAITPARRESAATVAAVLGLVSLMTVIYATKVVCGICEQVDDITEQARHRHTGGLVTTATDVEGGATDGAHGEEGCVFRTTPRVFL